MKQSKYSFKCYRSETAYKCEPMNFQAPPQKAFFAMIGCNFFKLIGIEVIFCK